MLLNLSALIQEKKFEAVLQIFLLNLNMCSCTGCKKYFYITISKFNSGFHLDYCSFSEMYLIQLRE